MRIIEWYPRCVSRPATPADHDFLKDVYVHAAWGPRSETDPDVDWMTRLYSGVLSRHVLVAGGSDRVGTVWAYRPDFKNLTCHVGFAAKPGKRDGMVLLGAALFITALFEEWPFRRVLGETIEPVFRQYSSADKFFTVDGRLPAHDVYNGHSVDRVLLSVGRDEWFENAGAYIRAWRTQLKPHSSA